MATFLGTEKEIAILKVLDDQDIFSAGHARVCFNCTKQILEIAGYPDENPDSYILKLACGAGGLEQTQAEIQCYLEHKYAPLAKILAYGRYIEIMERVDVCDYSDMADGYDENYSFADYLDDNDEEYSDDEECRMAEQAWEAIGILTEVFGYTADNGQLGVNAQGKVVAYDYGYYSGADVAQVSDLTEYIEINSDTLYIYINGLISILRKEEVILADFEEALIDGDGYLDYDRYIVIGYVSFCEEDYIDYSTVKYEGDLDYMIGHYKRYLIFSCAFNTGKLKDYKLFENKGCSEEEEKILTEEFLKRVK